MHCITTLPEFHPIAGPVLGADPSLIRPVAKTTTAHARSMQTSLFVRAVPEIAARERKHYFTMPSEEKSKNYEGYYAVHRILSSVWLPPT